jgi:hypothetical protein
MNGVMTATQRFLGATTGNRVPFIPVPGLKDNIVSFATTAVDSIQRLSAACSVRLTGAGVTGKTVTAYDTGHTEIGEKHVRSLQLSH